MASTGHDLSHKAGELSGQAQTGEQVKSMAQGAATAVKNTLGMNPDNTNPSSNTTISTANQPSNPTPTKI
ncbi:late embryogenesis abundant protein 2-like [Tripterygium wilfordii]|uniref:Late embryogenesis abundant protein 2-like n=1 Tax=Tripterygium wilfordii TaxID=458696 RepID=A0A7J7D5Y9_TRIWF|nr:late embryogenesis abundant protein 2-like [Tripterygium wilfordii]